MKNQFPNRFSNFEPIKNRCSNRRKTDVPRERLLLSVAVNQITLKAAQMNKPFVFPVHSTMTYVLLFVHWFTFWFYTGKRIWPTDFRNFKRLFLSACRPWKLLLAKEVIKVGETKSLKQKAKVRLRIDPTITVTALVAAFVLFKGGSCLETLVGPPRQRPVSLGWHTSPAPRG